MTMSLVASSMRVRPDRPLYQGLGGIGRGGTKPAAALVADLLGRPYRFEGFAEWLAPRPASG